MTDISETWRSYLMLTGIPTTFQDGEIIFAQNNPAADMYLIVSGHVRIVRETGDEQFELAKLSKGEFFGEMALFAPGPRSATAVAQGLVEVEVVDRTAFMAAIEDPVIRQILAKMSERLRLIDAAFTVALQAQEFSTEQP